MIMKHDKYNIIGNAYINYINYNESNVGEQFNSSIKRAELEKLIDNEKGEVKISFFKNARKREGMNDPDLNIFRAIRSNIAIANIYINKQMMLKQEGEKYIKFIIKDKNPKKLASNTARNMIVLSNHKNNEGVREVLGSGWNERKEYNTSETKNVSEEQPLYPEYNPTDPDWQGAAEELKFNAKEVGYKWDINDLQDLNYFAEEIQKFMLENEQEISSAEDEQIRETEDMQIIKQTDNVSEIYCMVNGEAIFQGTDQECVERIVKEQKKLDEFKEEVKQQDQELRDYYRDRNIKPSIEEEKIFEMKKAHSKGTLDNEKMSEIMENSERRKNKSIFASFKDDEEPRQVKKKKGPRF